MVQKYLITSALPYANGPLHFGHIAGAYLPGDCFARFQRLAGNDVVYICGSDEYGIAITLSAELANKTPKEHVDYFHVLNKNLFEKLNFSFDHFSRTTTHTHKDTVIDFFKDLYENGYIEKKVKDHLFSEKENRFLADRYVVGMCPKCKYPKARGDECPSCSASFEAIDLIDPKSKITGFSLIKKASAHWYLKFDKFKDRLKKWLETKDFKPNVINFTKSYVDELKERAITRDSAWGIPVPLDDAKGKVFYVWFDAPIGYISMTKEWAKKQNNVDLWKKYWLEADTKLIHFIGKDNIPFHTVFFPAMLMGQNLSYVLPFDVPANEFLMLEKKQFSKSDNWYIDLKDFFQKYTTDQIRYYLAAVSPEQSDSDFSWKDFQLRCNSELLGKLGNFVHRTLTFIMSKLDGVIPILNPNEDRDLNFIKEINKITDKAYFSYSSFKLRKASQCLMELAQLGNVYFDMQKPWELYKSQKIEKLKTIIACCLYCIKNIALISYPIIPESANKIWKLLGFFNPISDERWDGVNTEYLSQEQVLKKPYPLFKKIEDEQINEEIEKFMHENIDVLKDDKIDTYEKEKETVDFEDFEKFMPENIDVLKDDKIDTYEKEKETVDFEDFEKLDFRVAKIISAEKIEKSNKLIKLTVDLGFDKRTIVSGIAKHYNPEELIDKKVVVVVNLKPIKLMGIESRGMVLAAGLDNELELVELKNLKVGSSVR
jgi:methionyl-tRNA synthetase